MKRVCGAAASINTHHLFLCAYVAVTFCLSIVSAQGLEMVQIRSALVAERTQTSRRDLVMCMRDIIQNDAEAGDEKQSGAGDSPTSVQFPDQCNRPDHCCFP